MPDEMTLRLKSSTYLLYPGDTVVLTGADGSSVTYKPLDTARGPMFQVQSKTGPGDSR